MTTNVVEVNILVAHTNWKHALFSIIDTLDIANVDYILIDDASFFVQGVQQDARTAPEKLAFLLQWDRFAYTHGLFQEQHPTKIVEEETGTHFEFLYHSIPVTMHCNYNTVIATDPDRLSITYAERQLWVKALDYYLDDSIDGYGDNYPSGYPQILSHDAISRAAIKTHLRHLQQQNSQLNASAWNQHAYDAWVLRHGTPQEMAERIQKAPHLRLATLSKYLGNLQGKKVINLLGSHGSKALAMGLLGAAITIVDISLENAHYAREVALALNVPLRYLVVDVLQLPAEERTQSYDLLFMELGILHYFVDLEPLAQLVTQLLRPGGRLIVQDFHPITTKLITSKGKKHRVSGNYFDKSLTVTNVAFSKHLPTNTTTVPHQVYLRHWTLGEIVTAFAGAGLRIQRLDEEPNSKIDDIGLPKTFTLVAENPPALP
jgi:2-polyprenyl-3-methyl-5-hydroxy-6-metoxy-1,4-benzoquinol methylase